MDELGFLSTHAPEKQILHDFLLAIFKDQDLITTDNLHAYLCSVMNLANPATA